MTQQQIGMEHRRQPRRISLDRRNAVRWEPDKTGRRKDLGRRATDNLWKRREA